MTTLDLGNVHRVSAHAQLALSSLGEPYLSTRTRWLRDDKGYSHGEKVNIYFGPLNSHLDPSRLVGYVVLWSDDPKKEDPATVVRYDMFGKEVDMEQLTRAEDFKRHLERQDIPFRQEPSSSEVAERIRLLTQVHGKMIV